jgi:hypothetical protein
MGWAITDFKFIEDAAHARVFHFEATLGDGEAKRLLQGDGLLLGDGRVLVNRQAWLKRQAAGLGVDGESFVRDLQALASDRASQRLAASTA